MSNPWTQAFEFYQSPSLRVRIRQWIWTSETEVLVAMEIDGAGVWVVHSRHRYLGWVAESVGIETAREMFKKAARYQESRQ